MGYHSVVVHSGGTSKGSFQLRRKCTLNLHVWSIGGLQNACKRRHVVDLSESQVPGDTQSRARGTQASGLSRAEALHEPWNFEKLKVIFGLNCGIREFFKFPAVNCTQAYILYVKTTFNPVLTPVAEKVLTK